MTRARTKKGTSTVAKLRASRITIVELILERDAALAGRAAAEKQAAMAADLGLAAREETRRYAKESRELSNRVGALSDTCEKLLAVIAFSTDPKDAPRRAEVLAEALVSVAAHLAFGGDPR